LNNSGYIKQEYFRFVLNSLERELRLSKYNIDEKKVFNLINYIKNSDNILLDIYTLTKIKGLDRFARYLSFVYKKASTEKINFDNLYNNFCSDRDYIKSELIAFYGMTKPGPKRVKKTEPKEKKKEEFSTPKEELTEIKPSKDKFKIQKHDNELVTEEFIESDINEISETPYRFSGSEGIKKNYLELINTSKEEKGDEKVFELPDTNTKIKISGKIKKETPIPEKKSKKEKKRDEKQETLSSAFSLDDITGKPEENLTDKKTTDIPIEIPKEPSIDIKAIEIIEEEKPVEIITQNEKQPGEEKTDDEVLTKQINTEYTIYESELTTRNAQLDTDFDELQILITKKSKDTETKDNLYLKIIENATFMEEYSARMSFEVITNIYGIIKLAFFTATEESTDISKGYIPVFKDAIMLIESLVKGIDFSNQKKVIKGIEKIKTDIIEDKQQKESIRKIKKDKKELEKHLSQKYSDTTQIEKLILLKQYILEVENIFNSLDTIKGDYVSYEAVRRLSTTFIRFKEMVNISKILNIKKLAQLAESSYVFVKFIQNYRLNPFEAEIKEIFGYIVYNFKLIYLDKPTKELDLFISYLNDPVKIFDNIRKEKKKNNE
jgi:hypothetical protein